MVSTNLDQISQKEQVHTLKTTPSVSILAESDKREEDREEEMESDERGVISQLGGKRLKGHPTYQVF